MYRACQKKDVEECMDGWYILQLLISVINYRRMDVNNIIHQSLLHAFFNYGIYKGKRLIC